MDFITSDVHLCHKRIAISRGFADVDEMHEHIINIWNLFISSNDTVYVLGDLYIDNCSKQKLLSVVSKLNGNIILIPGNHDTPKELEYLIQQGCITKLQPLTNIRKKIHDVDVDIILCHYPLLMWRKMEYGSIHFHGHTHNLSIPHQPNRMNIGWDVYGRPLLIQEAFFTLKNT